MILLLLPNWAGPDVERVVGFVSVLVAQARYRFGGGAVGETATVPSELLDGITGRREGYDFRISVPNPEPSGRNLKASIIRAAALTVECSKRGDADNLNPDEALQLTADIATDVVTALVLNLPSLGLPGKTPYREFETVMIDGAEVGVSEDLHVDPYAFTLVAPVLTIEALTEAAVGNTRPSRARMMIGEAQHQALFNRKGSKVTAVIVAASACEIAVHECIRRFARGDSVKLSNALVPMGRQALLSPVKLVDVLIPVLVGRRLQDEDSELLREAKALFSARNDAVHQGKLSENVNAVDLIAVAFRLVRWIEALHAT